MDKLLADYGDKVVQSGKLQGAAFKALTEEQLQKLAKRCPGEPELSKFAKAWVILKELAPPAPVQPVQASEPEPCRPLVLAKRTWQQWASKQLEAVPVKYYKIAGCFGLCLVLQPLFGVILGRLAAQIFQRILNVGVNFWAAFNQQLWQDFTLAAESSLRSATPTMFQSASLRTNSTGCLPPSDPQWSWFSHAFAAGFGASLMHVFHTIHTMLTAAFQRLMQPGQDR